MHYRTTLLALAFATAVSPAVLAQAAAPPNPYKVLYVTRKSVKPGKSDAHDKLESEWARSLSAATKPYGILAIRSLTGPRETWFMSGFPSYAEYTRRSNAYSAIPAREDLSYGAMPNLPRMRFYTITRTSVRPGHVAEFEEARKLANQAHETARVADSYAVYQAAAGAPGGTFFIIIPRKSLADLDDDEKIHGPEYTAAMGGDDGRKKMAAFAANYLISSQSDLYAFVPSQSIVGANWAKEDPTYWKLHTTPPAP